MTIWRIQHWLQIVWRGEQRRIAVCASRRDQQYFHKKMKNTKQQLEKKIFHKKGTQRHRVAFSFARARQTAFDGAQTIEQLGLFARLDLRTKKNKTRATSIDVLAKDEERKPCNWPPKQSHALSHMQPNSIFKWSTTHQHNIEKKHDDDWLHHVVAEVCKVACCHEFWRANDFLQERCSHNAATKRRFVITELTPKKKKKKNIF